MMAASYSFFRDLSETSISRIPSTGLEQLEVLRIIGTKSMKTIPSVYYFKVNTN